MRSNSFLKIISLGFVGVVCVCCLSLEGFAVGSDDPNAAKVVNPAVGAQQVGTARQRMGSVKMADFYLRDEQFVFGKVVTEDKNKITIEQLDQGRLVVNTYSKRQVDTRTLRTKKVPEYKYYAELGDYFSGRTWDFENDTDDFIHAIRNYEKAKFALEQVYDANSEKIRDIDAQIVKVRADRDVWARETRSRAELKKLEFEATLDSRLKVLEESVNENMLQIGMILEKLDEIAGELSDDVRADSRRNESNARELGMLQERVDNNRRTIDRNKRSWRYPGRIFYSKEQTKNQRK